MNTSTSDGNNEQVVPAVPAKKQEVRMLMIIAIPLVAAYLAEMAMFITTNIVVGRLGYQELAAVGIAGSLTMEVVVVIMGLLSVIGIFVANAEGSGDRSVAGHATRQGLLLATLIGLPATVFVWNFGLVLPYLGQVPEVVRLADEYLPPASLMILPALWFTCFRNFVTAIAKTGAIMVITVAAVGLNYFLTVAMVHGRYGFPDLGVAGAGWAASLVTWIMFFALVGYVYVTPHFRGYGLFRDRIRFDGAVCREIIYLGTPVAGIVCMEAGLFFAVSVICGILGADILASYEILKSWFGITFMMALALAEAAMVRVAFGMGRGSMPSARQSGIISMAIGTSVLVALMFVPLNFSREIVNVFLDTDDPGFQIISATVDSMIIIAAVFQVFDGLQAIATRALRGIRDTMVPLWMAGFGYWVLGVGGGYVLTFPLGYGFGGIWTGLATGLVVTGTLLVFRFLRLTRSGIVN
jgi:multidrug resistance protein, MATE family